MLSKDTGKELTTYLLPKGQHCSILALADCYGINHEGDSDLLTGCRVVKEIYECLFHRRKAGVDGIIESHM